MASDGGGWTKILHYKNTAYTPNTAAVNPTGISTESTAAISSFAKLSDAQINAIGGSGVTKTYRISGDKTTKKYYTKSSGIWSNITVDYSLAVASRQVCENTTISNCTSWSTTNGSIDSLYDVPTGDDCDRYFTNGTGCFNPSDSTKRCFNSGVNCSSYSMINNLEIYLRE